MVTIYELLEVEENASKEDIEKAYSRLIFEFRQDMKFDAQTNKENENIVKNLRIAYEILSDDEKRKMYDTKLEQLRAEKSNSDINREKEKNDMTEKSDGLPPNKEETKILTAEEKENIKKNAQNEFDKNVKIVEEYVKSYNKAYTKYKINEKFKKIIEITIVILVFILLVYILFLIPQTRKIFINLYEENDIIRIFVDIIKNIINSIFKSE